MSFYSQLLLDDLSCFLFFGVQVLQNYFPLQNIKLSQQVCAQEYKLLLHIYIFPDCELFF